MFGNMYGNPVMKLCEVRFVVVQYGLKSEIVWQR
jgi:hypothetical protein